MESTTITKNLNKIVKEPVKENGIWIFADTECKADKKVCYTWTSYSKHSKTRKSLCCYRMMQALS